MIIQLGTLHFRTTTLPIGTKIFRAVTNCKYTFQPDCSSKIKEGRFNKDGQYCFYIASYMEAAILELISHYQNCTPQIIYVKELILKEKINLVDLTRYSYNYNSKPKDDYSNEHIKQV